MFTSVADGSSRKRKDVMYDDGLTERQFMRIMDKHSQDEEQPRHQEEQKVHLQGIHISTALLIANLFLVCANIIDSGVVFRHIFN